MATSTLRFYTVEFDKEDNPRIDNLEGYLSKIADATLFRENFQYIRHDLTIKIKLDSPQLATEDFDTNYVAIDEDNQTMYYYVDDVRQVAPMTLELTLSMDTVNSLVDPRDFTDETEIFRQHGDRFKKPTAWNPATGGTLVRRIDGESEGIVPDKTIWDRHYFEESSLERSWYLIYKNENDPDPEHPEATNPVEINLCSDKPAQVGRPSQGDSVTYDITDFDVGAYYYFLDIDNPSGTFEVLDTEFTLGDTVNKTESTKVLNSVVVTEKTKPVTSRALVIHRDTDSTLKYTIIYDDVFITFKYPSDTEMTLQASVVNSVVNQVIENTGTKWTLINDITFTQANFFRVSTTDYVSENLQPEGIKSLVTQEKGIYAGPGTIQILSRITDIDRTDPKLIKIIKYPYCPIPHTLLNSIWSFGEAWVYDQGLMRYTDNNLPALGTENIAKLELTNLTKSFAGPVTAKDNPSRVNESKFLHSDFHSVKFVYDSFSEEIKAERVHTLGNETDGTILISVDFKPTSTINSKFGFKFNPVYLSGSSTTSIDYGSEEDFDNLLLVTRNNEETILNNEYINYIKTGYNYDKKANALAVERANRSAAISTVGAGIGAAASILGLALGGPSVKAASAIGLGSTLASGALSTANAWQNVSDTQERINNAMAQKLAQLASQSTSTSGTDDVDLMSWYSNNKLWWMIYDIKELDEQKIYRLLWNTGYAHHTYDVPDVDSRIWFNFIQCNPHVERKNYLGKKKEAWIQALKEKYNEGVTVYHEIEGEWDFDKQYENFETWIIEGVN